jgi:hypothetical protein
MFVPVWLINATPNIRISASMRAYSLISPLSSFHNILIKTAPMPLARPEMVGTAIRGGLLLLKR